MDSYIEKRYGWRFWSLLGTALSLACLCGYLLYEDFHAKNSGGEGSPIATVERTENQVQRKPSNSFQWNTVEDKAYVYGKDTIRVGEKGFVKLKFADGKELELDENSYVVLNDQKGFGTDFIDILAGSAIVRTQGKEEQIDSTDGMMHQKKSLSVQLLSPKPRDLYFTKSKVRREIEFSWTGELPESGAVLEISEHKSFPPNGSQIVALTREMNHATSNFLAGEFFWRIRTETSTISRASSFKLQNVFTGIPKSPHTTAISVKDSPQVRFEWSLPSSAVQDDAADAGEHALQISRSKDFEPIDKEIAVSLNSGGTTVTGLEAGVFYWRMSSQFGDISLHSSTLTFTHELRTERPITLSNNQKEILSLASDPAATTQETTLKWNPDPSAERYVFELRRASDGKVIQTIETTNPDLALPVPAAGKYQWQVKAFVGEKKIAESAWSELNVVGTKQITLTAPQHNEAIPSDKIKALQFKWTPSEDDSKSHYRIKIARDSNFLLDPMSKDVNARETPATDFSLVHDKYYWRVDWLEENGVTIGTSPVATFRLGRKQELPPPKPLELAKGPLWDVMTEKKLPSIEWEKVPGAQKYEILVKQNDKLVLRDLTSQNRFDLKQRINGDFNWTVRAIDETGTPGEFMEPKSLKVLYPKLPAPKGLRSQTAKSKAKRR